MSEPRDAGEGADLRLYKVLVKHYAPRDSHESIEGWVIATSEEQVLAWVPTDMWNDWENDGDEGSVGPSDDWWDEHPEEPARAKAMGLTVHLCDWGDRDGKPDWVEGPKTVLLRWWRGDTFRELSDLHYGATTWSWDEGQSIGDMQALMLLDIGIASDARDLG